ncbi:MAG: hypothetical protein AAGB15_12100 [Pseudomonadota bacterium]
MLGLEDLEIDRADGSTTVTYGANRDETILDGFTGKLTEADFIFSNFG